MEIRGRNIYLGLGPTALKVKLTLRRISRNLSLLGSVDKYPIMLARIWSKVEL